MSGVDGLYTKHTGLPSLSAVMEGAVLPVYKPKTWTSFDVVRRVRRRLQGAKVGHAGTLDPLAEGLLIVCVGSKTKSIEEWMGHSKEYEAVLELGAETDSYDLETPVRVTGNPEGLTTEFLLQGMAPYVGTISQVPPAHSAVKVGGVRAYAQARKGNLLQLEPRWVRIDALDLLSWQCPELHLRVACSKGTYIRSLARDLGQTFGCGAYLKGLVRTRIGALDTTQAFHLEDFDAFLQFQSSRHP